LKNVLIPQWGGISLLPNAELESFETAMGYFLHHLYKLFHVPEGTLYIPVNNDALPIKVDRFRDGHPTPYMVRQMKRRRLLECSQQSKASLSALIRLTKRIPTMTIRDKIAQRVKSALHISQEEGHVASPTWTEAKNAFVQSDRAFFDETMVSQLYFPDEHTYAIYLPLFLPITISLLMITMQELKQWLRQRTSSIHLKAE